MALRAQSSAALRLLDRGPTGHERKCIRAALVRAGQGVAGQLYSHWMDLVSLEHTEDCARIRLTNGDTNTLTTPVIQELAAVIDDAERSSRGILLAGGDKFFSNGIDLTWALAQSPAGMRQMFLELGHLLLRLMETPLPVVGVIKGHAIGGAKSLFLACDYRYAATGRVLLGAPEIQLGVPNPYYADRLLRFVAGDAIASDLIYSGKLINAEDAAGLGLVHAVGERDEIEATAWQRLKALAELAPEAFAESKLMRAGAFCADVRHQLSARVARQVEIWNSPEAQARLHTAAERLSR